MIFKLFSRNILLVSYVFILQSIILLLSAKAIESSVVASSAGLDLVLLSIILSITMVVYFSKLKLNNIKYSILLAIFYFLFISFFSILKNGFWGNESYYMKLIICIICGEIIGNFLGNHRHNKLRNSTKRRSLTTK